ncbi:MAG: hypothetical protein K2K73_02540, partial [Ureaplasma sp.]|nr:hypothetical protein [Ureaplasma sp.]
YSINDFNNFIDSIKSFSRLCRVICFICENEKVLEDDKIIEQYIYKIIFKNEMSLNNYKNIEIIKDSYDSKQSFKNISTLFSEYQLNNAELINNIVFIDSNLLS